MRIKTIDNNLPEKQSLRHSGFKHGKKFVLIVAVVAIAIIAGALLIPQGAASIPLNVSYNVGEKMVYNTTMSLSSTVNNSTPSNIGYLTNNITIPGTQTIDVQSFDGQIFTLNSTSTMAEGGRPFTFSTIEKMNKTGYTTAFLNLGNTSEEIPENGPTSNQYLAQLLSKPEVKVGDSVTIPYPSLPSNLSSNIQTTGDLTLTFKGMQELTVPAGTYKVFEVDLTSNNLSMTVELQSISGDPSAPNQPRSMTTNITLNFQMFIEYNTMRQIQSSMQETTSMQSATLNYAMATSMQMTLNQDIQP